MRGRILASLLLCVLVYSTPVGAAPLPRGLVLYDEGPAVFYSHAFDYGGWDTIIRRHLSWGQLDRPFPYDPDGWYCVHPDYAFGNILTLRNPKNGKSGTCTVADSVAPGDVGNWRRHAVVELSYVAFTALGLDDVNDVQVWVMPGG